MTQALFVGIDFFSTFVMYCTIIFASSALLIGLYNLAVSIVVARVIVFFLAHSNAKTSSGSTTGVGVDGVVGIMVSHPENVMIEFVGPNDHPPKSHQFVGNVTLPVVFPPVLVDHVVVDHVFVLPVLVEPDSTIVKPIVVLAADVVVTYHHTRYPRQAITLSKIFVVCCIYS